MEIGVTLLIMLVCLAGEAFFSGSEIGVVSADRMKLRHEAARGSRGAKIALRMLEKPELLLSTTLVGTNISVVANTTLATALMINLFGEQYAWLAIILVAPFIWIFGEIVAKSVFQQRADVLTPIIIYILRGASYLFWPILLVFSLLTRVLAKKLAVKGIAVNAVAPGPFESKMMAATLDAFGDQIRETCPMKRIGEPEDMAGIAIYLASRAGAFVTGAVIPVDGGIAFLK